MTDLKNVLYPQRVLDFPVVDGKDVFFVLDKEEQKAGICVDDMVYLIDLRKSEFKDALKILLLQSRRVIGYNISSDLSFLSFSYSELKNLKVEDVWLLAKVVLYREDVGESLDLLIKKLLMKDINGSVVERVYYLQELFEKLKEGENLEVYRLDCEMAKVVADVNRLGMPFVSYYAWNELKKVRKEMEKISREVGGILGEKINLNSPEQIKRATGFKGTSKEELYLVYFTGNEREKALASLILQYRELESLRRFLEKVISIDDNRLRGEFIVAASASGRMSCRNENLQSIDRRIRHIFEVWDDEKDVLMSFDFPQIELKLAAVLWDEKELTKAFKEGRDVHAMMARKIYGKEEVSEEERSMGKKANFGFLYGMSSAGFIRACLREGVLVSEDFARKIEKAFRTLYRNISERQKLVLEKFKNSSEHEYWTCLKRPYVARSPMEYLNYQIQGCAAELLKSFVVRLKKKYENLKIVNLIHDEVVIEVEKAYVEDLTRELPALAQETWEWLLENADKTYGREHEKIELKAEPPVYGKSWGELL